MFANLFRKKKVNEVVSAANPIDLLPPELKEEFKASGIPSTDLESREDWILLLNCFFFGSARQDYRPLADLLQEYDDFQKQSSTASQASAEVGSTELHGVSPIPVRRKSPTVSKKGEGDRKSPVLGRIAEAPESVPVVGPSSSLPLSGTRSVSPKPKRGRSGSARVNSVAKLEGRGHGNASALESPSRQVISRSDDAESPVNTTKTYPKRARKDMDPLGDMQNSDSDSSCASSACPTLTPSLASQDISPPNQDADSVGSVSSYQSPPPSRASSRSPSKSKRRRSSPPAAETPLNQGVSPLSPHVIVRSASPAQRLIEAKLGGTEGSMSLPGAYEPSASESEGGFSPNITGGLGPTDDLLAALQPIMMTENATPTILQPPSFSVTKHPSAPVSPTQGSKRDHKRNGKSSVSPDSPYRRTGSIPLSKEERTSSNHGGVSMVSVSTSPVKSRHLSSSGVSPPTPKSKKMRARSLSGLEADTEETSRGRSAIPNLRSGSARSRSPSPMSYMGEGRLLTNTAARTPAPVIEDYFIMEDALTHYKLLEKLGKGSFGNVYVAKLRKEKSSRRFAAKKSLIDSKRRMQTMCREIGNLRNANHRNIVRMIASYYHKEVAWIVMEFCDAGTLRDLRYCTTLKEAHIAYIMREVLFGLEYMHVNGMMHRDIKGENVLLNADGEVKVADLGLAVPAQEDQKRIAGSKYWMAPEMILAAGYGPKADIYSLGCTAYELANGLPPYAQFSAIRALFCAAKHGFPPLDCPSAWSTEFLDFLAVCTHPNPRDRPSCTELLQHPFLHKACSKADFAKVIAAAFAMEAFGFDY